MLIAEIILYVLVIFLYFFLRYIKKHYINEKRVLRYKETDRETFKKILKKPMWVKKANYGFMIFCFIFLFILLSSGLTYIWSQLKSLLVLNDKGSVFFNSDWGISFLPFIFISLPLSNLIIECLPFKTARYMYEFHYNVPTLEHSRDVKFTLILFIIIFIIGFPFIILNTDCYSRLSQDKLYVNRYWGISEVEYSIPEDIDHAEYQLSYDKYGRTYYFYVYFNDGSNVELPNSVELNNILLDKGVTIY